MTARKSSFTAMLLVAALGAMILLPFAARAGENEQRWMTYGLGAATGYFLLKKQWVPAAVAGAGTAVMHNQWQASINKRHRKNAYLSSRYYRSRSYGRVHHRRRR